VIVNRVQVRYVIDFYTGMPHPEKPVTMHLDVRPALDSFGALKTRVLAEARKVAEEVKEALAPAPSQVASRPAAEVGKGGEASA
jgi:hypothetical protein